MSIIRTDEQADALEILKQIIETANFYRAMGALLAEEDGHETLEEIANQREEYIEPFQNIVEELDEFPSTPDSDKELVEELAGKLTKLLSADFKLAIHDKCLNKDQVLADLIEQTVLAEKSAEYKSLLDSLAEHLAKTKKYLH